MTLANEQVAEALNRLIETCKDGENGFRTAATGVKTRELKQLFESYAAQRARFAGELQAAVEQLGGRPQERGSVAGVLHRGWMNIKGLVTGHDDAAIIQECETGEDAAMKTYMEAIQQELPQDVQTVISLE